MGRVSNSFKSQIGRDAGKVVSNVLFGDKHATPYRRAASKGEAGQRVSNNAELEKRKLEIQEENLKKKDLYALDKAVIEAVDRVIATPLPDNEKEILKLANDLEVQLEANDWFDVSGNAKEEAKIRNKYPDAVLKKYEQCLTELKFSGANPDRLKFLNEKLAKYKSKRRKARTKNTRQIILIIIILIVVCLILLAIGD
jgi:hypothetical protein